MTDDLAIIAPLLDALAALGASVPCLTGGPGIHEDARRIVPTASAIASILSSIAPDGDAEPFLGVRGRVDDASGSIEILAPVRDDPENPLGIAFHVERVDRIRMSGDIVRSRVDGEPAHIRAHGFAATLTGRGLLDVCHRLNVLPAERRNPMLAVVTEAACRATTSCCRSLLEARLRASAEQARDRAMPILAAALVVAMDANGTDHPLFCGSSTGPDDAPVIFVRSPSGDGPPSQIVAVIPVVSRMLPTPTLRFVHAHDVGPNGDTWIKLDLGQEIEVTGNDLPDDPVALARLARSLPAEQAEAIRAVVARTWGRSR